jgi:hypothetical protein
MSRSFYVLAATLALFAALSCGMALVPSSYQPGLPANASLWKTLGTMLLLGSLFSALFAVMTTLFEQVDRRTEERRRKERSKRP